MGISSKPGKNLATWRIVIDLEAIRERLRSLRAAANDPRKQMRPDTVELLEVAASDIDRLMNEVDGLRSSCRHSHLIDEVDDKGRHTGTSICVTCHRHFDREEPLPGEPSGDLG